MDESLSILFFFSDFADFFPRFLHPFQLDLLELLYHSRWRSGQKFVTWKTELHQLKAICDSNIKPLLHLYEFYPVVSMAFCALVFLVNKSPPCVFKKTITRKVCRKTERKRTRKRLTKRTVNSDFWKLKNCLT